MRTRILIFDSAGAPLLGFDGGSTTGHAARFVAENLEQLAVVGITDCTVVEFDPLGTADDAVDTIQTLHAHRVEFRRRPDGRREIVDLVRWNDPADPARLRTSTRCVRAFRLIHAAPDIVGARQRIRGTPP